jgi:hypothetical protein
MRSKSRFRTAGALSLLGWLGVSCATDPGPIVASRAAFDLDCAGANIKVEEGPECTYYARGCGKKAAYIVRARVDGSMICCPPIGCDAILNGAVGEDRYAPMTPSTPPPSPPVATPAAPRPADVYP